MGDAGENDDDVHDNNNGDDKDYTKNKKTKLRWY